MFPEDKKICIYSDSSDPLPLKHGGLGQRPKCLIITFTLKSVRLAAQDSILHTKQLFNEKIKVTCCWFTCLSELLTEYVVFFICNLMSIMITSPDGTLSLAKVKCILVKPAVCTSHVCCILDKITGALMLPETGSLFGILRSYNWNSTLVVIDGPWVHVVKWIFRSVVSSSCWSHDPEAMPVRTQITVLSRIRSWIMRVWWRRKRFFPQQFLLFRTIFRSGSCFHSRLNRADSKAGSNWFTEEIPICSGAVGQPFPSSVVSHTCTASRRITLEFRFVILIVTFDQF